MDSKEIQTDALHAPATQLHAEMLPLCAPELYVTMEDTHTSDQDNVAPTAVILVKECCVLK